MLLLILCPSNIKFKSDQILRLRGQKNSRISHSNLVNLKQSFGVLLTINDNELDAVALWRLHHHRTRTRQWTRTGQQTAHWGFKYFLTMGKMPRQIAIISEETGEWLRIKTHPKTDSFDRESNRKNNCHKNWTSDIIARCLILLQFFVKSLNLKMALLVGLTLAFCCSSTALRSWAPFISFAPWPSSSCGSQGRDMWRGGRVCLARARALATNRPYFLLDTKNEDT